MDFRKKMMESGEYGIVQNVRHPIVVASGLPGARLSEIVMFETGEMGEVFLMERDQLEILVFSKDPIKVGTKIIRLNSFLSVPVGDALLGSVVDPLGNLVSQSAQNINFEGSRQIDNSPLGIAYRARIKKPLLTGVTIIDTMVPLGYGQKELILGDRKTGKTSFILSTIKNQIEQGSIAIYAGISKRKSDIKKVEDFLSREGLTDSSIIIATTPYDSPSLIYTTPFSAITIAEYFRDKGRDVVVVLDDLSTHARAYLEISLLAKRFPGRDSYPGDIFHTHARIMERAGNFNLSEGREASITILPVAEVVEGDLTGYITTNLMSMTDGHIFFDSNIYFEGRRPAVNIPLSVTRVGRQAQTPLLRSINREIGAFLTLYDRVANLSHFGAELNQTVKETIATGESLYLFFNQHYNVSIPIHAQVVLYGLLWLNLIDRTELGLEKAKLKMIEAYSDEGNRKYFDDAYAKQTFNELLQYVTQNKDLFISICKTENK
ncbi:MAG: F0F1 ATP synthase subunit alpha [Candidatus Saccharibacteria bacterium]|nr:F0F1 ATP synthase subunit alpha [Candidatus Saccharibacteria bacterium]